MKREDLLKLGIEDALVDKIMSLHGADVEGHKTKLATAQTEIDGLKKQVEEAGKQIEGFKGMDIEGVKKSADEWKLKAETAAAEGAKQLAQMRFDHALDGALTGAKARNAKAVKALLSTDILKLSEDGSIQGLKEQLEKIKTENEFLFDGGVVDPKIVTHTNNQSILGDKVVDAARAAAGLSPAKQG